MNISGLPLCFVKKKGCSVVNQVFLPVNPRGGPRPEGPRGRGQRGDRGQDDSRTVVKRQRDERGRVPAPRHDFIGQEVPEVSPCRSVLFVHKEKVLTLRNKTAVTESKEKPLDVGTAFPGSASLPVRVED